MSRAELLYALAAGGANIVGALAVTTRARWTRRALDTMLSLAAGFLISVAMIDLFPDALARDGARAAVIVLLSYLAVHITQHTIGRHFHFGEETHEVSEVVSVSALVGLLLHTFVDGVAVASGLRVSEVLGALVFVAVVLHKFPEGLAISSLFLAAGAGRARALSAAAALGLATVLGVLLTDSIAFLREYGLAISAGVTLYVGASNLVPEFQSRREWRLPLSFLAGCGLYFAARSLAGAGVTR
ncbi:MAG TPA: ZIP family metal transporter [Gemmatimonadaceae bacterium]|nr:ZIP family metal transporter [Gemmatimonadaceae bacterium]